jgi:hypothetical protein
MKQILCLATMLLVMNLCYAGGFSCNRSKKTEEMNSCVAGAKSYCSSHESDCKGTTPEEHCEKGYARKCGGR